MKMNPLFLSVGAAPEEMRLLLVIMGIVSVIMLLVCILVALSHPFSRRHKGALGPGAACFVFLATLLQVGMLVLCIAVYIATGKDIAPDNYVPVIGTVSTEPSDEEVTGDIDATNDTEATAESQVQETEAPDVRLSFQPVGSDAADPANWDMTWEIIVNDEIVESFTREEPISFGYDCDYFALPGVATFRGNNHRNSPTYGTANITQGKISRLWKYQIGMFNDWGGCCWTGQPLVVQWDDETKAIMNLYKDKKEKDGLVEVIYAKLDGYIHFYDLEDGTYTRDPIRIGMNFKGAGALDPRGYPVLYVGSGLSVGNKDPRMYAISLIDGSILWQFGNNDKFSERDWFAFDSSPLVDAETDTLIWPGEDGLLYTIKLNTEYDKAAGTFSINPDTPVRTRYSSVYSEDKDRYLGYESSACIVDEYLYVSENGGLFHCVNLNTMELVWAQDTKDDSNSSPLFDWGEDDRGYIYTAPSLHWTQKNHKGVISIYKLDAQTGEIIWTHEMECETHDGISGGVQSSPLMGKKGSDIEDLIIYTVGRSPTAWKGQLVALNKHTGEVVWQASTGNYTWSSPVALYNEDGKSYIFLGNASGVCRLVDGATGELLDTVDLDQTIEASPVVFNDTVIIGTREGVYAFRIY